MSEAVAGQMLRKVAAAEGIELLSPNCPHGIGTLIQSLDSPALIAGVRLEAYTQWADDRGHFLEVLRSGQGLAAGFDPATTQVSVSLSYPGTIKAFHYHLRQTDVWTVAAGMMQAALVDLRKGSATFGARNTLYIGELRPWRLLIPPGVGHGCKTVGTQPAVLVYATDRFYDPADEGRIPFNDPSINYDWEIHYK